MIRLRRAWETAQVKVGSSIAVLYVAAISLVGLEVMTVILESVLIVPTVAPLAPLVVVVLGTVAILRRRAVLRRAGTTARADHVARAPRVPAGRALRGGPPRHP